MQNESFNDRNEIPNTRGNKVWKDRIALVEAVTYVFLFIYTLDAL